MPTLHVCSLSRLSETIDATGAGHLVTLINVGTPFERPKLIDTNRHLLLHLSDIAVPMEGHVPPDDMHVRSLLDFVHRWDRKKPLLIHCYAGISRSTAAAYVAACALLPDRDERQIAQSLRAASVTATPNRLLVEIADRLLGRDGRMVTAIAEIGRGSEAFQGEPFCIHLT